MHKVTHKGTDYEFESFDYDEDNLGKINLEDKDGDSEGIWVILHPDYKEKYNNEESCDEPVICFLANQSLSGLPWGAVVVAETQGDCRPLGKIKDLSGNVVLMGQSD
jgi:hypothetical protein